MSTHDPTGEPGHSTSPPRARPRAASGRSARAGSDSRMSMTRCAACDAPNVDDRVTCWRCLRDLSESAGIAETSLDRTAVVEAALGREWSGASRETGASAPVATASAPIVTSQAASRSSAAPTSAAPVAVPVRPDLTPIKVVPLRPASPAIMPTSWPPSTDARRGRRLRSVLAASLAAILTVAIAAIVVVSGILPGTVDQDGPGDPLTAQLAGPSIEPSAAVEPAVAATVEPAATPVAHDPVEAATPAAVGQVAVAPLATESVAADPITTPAPERTRRPRAATAAAPDAAAADEPATPEGTQASTSGMRGAKKANAFVCANDAPRIRDPFDRTWRVSKVSYSTQPGFERVILHLRRIGVTPPPSGTVAIAGRVPAAKMADFPEDVRPEKKRRRLLRIDLAGVPDAPDLRAFRLLGMGHVGELSLLPGKNGRTALLTIDGDACYRVRVPAWSPSADKDAKQAEIVIDIKGR